MRQLTFLDAITALMVLSLLPDLGYIPFFFLLGIRIPLALSYKAITTYTGYDKKDVYRRIVAQRILYILWFQSIPLSCVLTLSFFYLLIWCLINIICIISIRILIYICKYGNIFKYSLCLYHPYAHQKAGGEMVLWRLIYAISRSYKLNTIFNTHNISCNINNNHNISPSIVVFSSVVQDSFIQQYQKARHNKDNNGNTDNTTKCASKTSQKSHDNRDNSGMIDTTLFCMESSSLYNYNTSKMYTTLCKLEEYSINHANTVFNTDILSQIPYNKTTSSLLSADVVTKRDDCTSLQAKQNNHIHQIHDTLPNASLPQNTTNYSDVNHSTLRQYIISDISNTFGMSLDIDDNASIYDNTNESSPQHLPPPPPSPASSPLVDFVFLTHTSLSDSQHYPRLTLLLQTYNAFIPLLHYILVLLYDSMICMIQNIIYNDPKRHEKVTKQLILPLIVVDTAGYPIIPLLCTLLGLPSASYTHYPIIQHDMIQRNIQQTTSDIIYTIDDMNRDSRLITSVGIGQESSPSLNNNPMRQIENGQNNKTRKSTVQQLKMYAKHYYFVSLLYIYRILLLSNVYIYANGSWTYNHLYNIINHKYICDNILLWFINLIKPVISSSLIDIIDKSDPTLLASAQKHNSIQQLTPYLDILYPPCNLPREKLLSQLSNKETTDIKNNAHTNQDNTTLSESDINIPLSYQHEYIESLYPFFIMLGQYRPEKQLPLILSAFHNMLQQRANIYNTEHDKSTATHNTPQSSFTSSSSSSSSDKEGNDKDNIDVSSLSSSDNPLYIHNKPISLLFIGTIRPLDYNIYLGLQQYIYTHNIRLYNKATNTYINIPLSNHIHIYCNIPLQSLQYIMMSSLCGLHAMVDEHFGIGVAELGYLCSNICANKSAGPLLDIITPQRNSNGNDSIQLPHHTAGIGYLSSSRHEYTIMMKNVLDDYQHTLDMFTNKSDVSSSSSSSWNMVMNHAWAQLVLYNRFSLDVFDKNVQKQFLSVLDATINTSLVVSAVPVPQSSGKSSNDDNILQHKDIKQH